MVSKLRCVLGLFILTIGTTVAFASLPPSANLFDVAPAKSLSVKFYRNSKSLYASGESNYQDLEKTKIREFFDYSLLLESGDSEFWIPADRMARDMSLSTTVISIKDGEKYHIIETKESWLLGKRLSDGAMLWHPVQDLVPDSNDLGAAVTLVPLLLRAEPSEKSQVKAQAEARTKWEIIDWQEDWVLIKDPHQPSKWGYANVDSLLLKHDFAGYVMTLSKKWVPVQYRQGGVLITAKGGSIPLRNVRGILTKPDLAISMINQIKPALAIRQNFRIKKWAADIWVVSFLKGHGEVFWKKTGNEAKVENNFGLHTEELLKREVYSVSFHPKTNKFGIVSAGGIFLTKDGINWAQLPDFKESNSPVLISAAGAIYVGDRRSTDNGKTFTQYFQWAQLAEAVQEALKAPPHVLRITSIESISPTILRLNFDTGIRRVSVAGQIQKGQLTNLQAQ